MAMVAIVDHVQLVGKLMGIEHPADEVDVHRIIFDPMMVSGARGVGVSIIAALREALFASATGGTGAREVGAYFSPLRKRVLGMSRDCKMEPCSYLHRLVGVLPIL